MGLRPGSNQLYGEVTSLFFHFIVWKICIQRNYSSWYLEDIIKNHQTEKELFPKCRVVYICGINLIFNVTFHFLKVQFFENGRVDFFFFFLKGSVSQMSKSCELWLRDFVL